jgi:unsaturated rhamnogalacturonyl hydrolase
MRRNLFVNMVLCLTICGYAVAQKGQPLSEEIQPGQIRSVMTKVADWQLANPSKHDTAAWTHATLFAGMTAWAQMADTDTYYDALLGFGEKNDWKIRKRKNNVYHGDDHAVAQMYIDLYKKYKDPKMIAPIQKLFDYILANQPNTPLTHNNKKNKKRYNWCDALFMAPPVWAKLARITGQTEYLDYMNKEWWATTDYLYNTEEHLYFRDDNYFDKREKNGEKVFWSRGNGWVLGGLVRVLEELPEDHPDRAKYEKIYKQMAAKLIAIQPPEGLWHSSLLDPVSFPTKEASGSGFYCYGLAWGINHGLLDAKTYLPAVRKAWVGLVDCVHPDGKLGNVQPVGADPRHVTADQTEIYGVGAFLLAGSEVYKIAIRDGQEVKELTVTNPTLSFRDGETVGLNFKDVKKAVPGLTKDNVAVLDFKTNRLLVTQVVQGKNKTELLFQTDMAPGEKKYFWVMKQPADMEKPESKAAAYCRFIPERKDDFAWENDKTAFRMYGPALEDETITCGIDAWAKCVSTPFIDKAYKSGSYHKNHGEGGDFYKVGNTLGCGGAAPLVDGKIRLSNHNFKEWKILENGPIRAVFELTYALWKAGPYTLSETKRISIDLGSNLNKIECFYSSDNAQTVPVAAGILLQKRSQKFKDAKNNTIAYWLSAGKNGMMGCGVIFGADAESRIVEADNHLLMVEDHSISEPFVYYSGSCWDKNQEFNSFEKWQKYLKNFKERIDNPVTIQFAK